MMAETTRRQRPASLGTGDPLGDSISAPPLQPLVGGDLPEALALGGPRRAEALEDSDPFRDDGGVDRCVIATREGLPEPLVRTQELPDLVDDDQVLLVQQILEQLVADHSHRLGTDGFSQCSDDQVETGARILSRKPCQNGREDGGFALLPRELMTTLQRSKPRLKMREIDREKICR